MFVAVDSHLVERLLALAKSVVVRRIHGNAGTEPGKLFEDVNDAAGIWKRQRAQQHAIYDGKDRRIGTDSQSESRHGDQSHAPGFEEHPDRVSQILLEAVHGSSREQPSAEKKLRAARLPAMGRPCGGTQLARFQCLKTSREGFRCDWRPILGLTVRCRTSPTEKQARLLCERMLPFLWENP